MPHFPKPFDRRARGLWYVQVAGRQINFGPDREAAFRRYHELMGQPLERHAELADDTVVGIFDVYLDWVLSPRASALPELADVSRTGSEPGPAQS